MTAATSAGIVLFRRTSAGHEILLGHMGGPFWTRKDAGAWTIPKGLIDADEDPLAAARREFTEELGLPAPTGSYRSLGEIRQRGGKRVVAWAVEGDLDPDDITPGTFELEWPPRSGRRRSFPELDRVGWFTLAEANRLIVTGQRELLARLATALA